MRPRAKIIRTLEAVYREAYERADRASDDARKESLDFGFQRDQVMLEAILDLRDALAAATPGAEGEEAKPESSLIDKAMAIRKFTRLGPR